MPTLARTIACCAILAFAACGTHHDDAGDHDDATATLSVDPPSAELTLTPTTPGRQLYTAIATYPNGDTRDVTAEVVFGIDSTFGSFMQTQLAMVAAGKATVTAVWTPPSVDVKTANATVIGRMNLVRIDPTLPANTADLFDAATEDAARAPVIVYPQTGVVIPRNLGDFEAHWTDASGNNVFELSLHTDFSSVRIFLPGGNGEVAAGAMPTWASFLAAEWIAAVGREQTVNFRVRGLALANPTVVGSTPPRLVKLSNEEMQGGLYYWGVYDAPPRQPQLSGVWRHDMAQPGVQAEEYLSGMNTASSKCVACHSLSRDGTKMAITYSGGNGKGALVDVATKATQAADNNWNFGSFTPDGEELMGSFNGVITIRKASDQSTVMPVPTGGYATHPDVSADGKHVAYVQAADIGEDWHFGGGSIVVIDYDQATHMFGAPRTLVDNANNTINNYYPSWSPDNAWILFNRSSDNSAGGAYNNPSASLWVVKADGTGQPIELATANLSGGLTNSWGRWAPFGQTVGASNRPMYWVTTSSKRTYGVRRQFSEDWPSIWMFPFYPDAASAATDPTGPAFRLPFQDFLSHNHIAQWTERVVVTQ